MEPLFLHLHHLERIGLDLLMLGWLGFLPGRPVHNVPTIRLVQLSGPPTMLIDSENRAPIDVCCCCPSLFSGLYTTATSTGEVWHWSEPGVPVAFSDTFPVLGGDPLGLAASPNMLVATDNCEPLVYSVATDGSLSILATIPEDPGCTEKYLAIAPPESVSVGFTEGDVFVTQGVHIYKIHSGVITLFSTIPGVSIEDTGITFDRIGTFGNKMIVALNTNDGSTPVKIYSVSSSGATTLVASIDDDPSFGLTEHPCVAAADFGTYAGQILIASENYNFGAGGVHAITPGGSVTYDIFVDVVSVSGPEQVVVIPPGFPLAGGATGSSVLVTSEAGSGIFQITWNGSGYDSNYFGNIPGAGFEQSAFAV